MLNNSNSGTLYLLTNKTLREEVVSLERFYFHISLQCQIVWLQITTEICQTLLHSAAFLAKPLGHGIH